MAKKESTIISRLSRFLLVISAVSLALRLWSKGLMDAQKAAIFLVLVVIASAWDNVVIKFVFAIFGLGYFVIDYLDYDISKFKTASVSVLALLIVLFGIFVMFGGMRKK